MAHAIGTSPPNKKCVTFGIERVWKSWMRMIWTFWIHDECCKGMHFQATRPFSNTLCLRNTPSLWYPVSLWSLCCGTCGTWDWTWSSKSHRIRCLWGYQNHSLLERRGTLAGSCNGVHSIEGLCRAFWLLRVVSIQLWFSKAWKVFSWQGMENRGKPFGRGFWCPNDMTHTQTRESVSTCMGTNFSKDLLRIGLFMVYLWVWLVGGNYWWGEVSFWKCWNLTSSILKTWGERKPPKHCTTWRMDWAHNSVTFGPRSEQRAHNANMLSLEQRNCGWKMRHIGHIDPYFLCCK
jgi:hypothetical protein